MNTLGATFSRRWALGTTLAAAATAGAAPAASNNAGSANAVPPVGKPAANDAAAIWPAPGDRRQISNGVMHFASPEEHLESLMRVERTMDEKEVAWWFWFVWFLMVPGRSPIPLMRYEGMEMSRHKQFPGHRFIVHGHNLSFPRDLVSGDYISEIINPVTGAKVPAGTSVITNDPGYEFTPQGVRPLTSDKRHTLDEFWRIEDGLLHMQRVRTPPPEWPGQFIEQNTTTVSLTDFRRPRLLRLPSRSAGTWLQPAPRWLGFPLEMNALVLGHFDGRKLEDLQQFPREYLARVQQEYPQLLAVDEAKFTKSP